MVSDKVALIAVIEFIIICVMSYFLFRPSDSVDLTKYNDLKNKLSKEVLEYNQYKDAMRVRIDDLERQNASLRDKNDIDQTRKNENNEKTAIDVDVIRNSPLDTLIVTDEQWPEGY